MGQRQTERECSNKKAETKRSKRRAKRMKRAKRKTQSLRSRRERPMMWWKKQFKGTDSKKAVGGSKKCRLIHHISSW
jgi:hypothetical protein